MSPEHVRLYALARVAVSSAFRVRTFAEPTTGGQVMYTIGVEPPYPGGRARHFAVHSSTLRDCLVPDFALLHDIRRAVNRV